jgi:hypothetical protein
VFLEPFLRFGDEELFLEHFELNKAVAGKELENALLLVENE